MRYRPTVVLTSLLTLAAATAGAQTITPGVKIGIDFASLPNAGNVFDQVTHRTSTETSSKVGAFVGGFVVVPIMDNFAFQPELDYVAKGVKLNQGANGGTVTASLRYLEFPMLLRYATSISGHAAYLLVGPTFGVKAGTSGKLEAPDQTVDVDIDPAVRTFDGGILFGAGVDYGRYLFEVRYTQGLTDVGSDLFPHSDSIKNRVFAIAAGVRLK